MDNKIVGANILRFRNAIGMSQDELAQKCGYFDRSSIVRIERGERGVSQSKMVAVAKALGYSPGELLNWDNEMAEMQKLNEHKQKVIIAYRNKQDMQPAVDKLLGIENKSTKTIPARPAAFDGGTKDVKLT